VSWIRGRVHLVAAVLVLGLGLGGVALAQRSSGSAQVNVTILDGKLKVSPTTFAVGKLTLVVVNKGKLPHALAIMGVGLGAKRTATLGSGKSARLTVTVKAGMYHVWDPVSSSMSHATMLVARATSAAPSSKTSGGSTSGGATSGGSTSGGTSGTGGAVGSTDPCAGM
jgi:uncharacterized membrane protein YgcG